MLQVLGFGEANFVVAKSASLFTHVAPSKTRPMLKQLQLLQTLLRGHQIPLSFISCFTPA